MFKKFGVERAPKVFEILTVFPLRYDNLSSLVLLDSDGSSGIVTSSGDKLLHVDLASGKVTEIYSLGPNENVT